MRKTLAILAISGVLSACAQFPELDAAVSEEAMRADFPKIVPSEQVTARRDAGRLSEEDGPALLARAARLKRRAEILRAIPVIDEAARLRFASLLRRLGG